MEQQPTTSTANSDDDSIITILYERASVLFQEYQQSHNVSLFQTAFGMARFAAQPGPGLRNHPRRSAILDCFHGMLRERYLLTKQAQDMVNGVMLMNDALELLPADDEYTTTVVNAMTDLFCECTKPFVSHAPIAQGDARGRDIRRAVLLHAVSDLYKARFDALKSQEDFEDSCHVLRKALACSPKDYPLLLDWCIKLGSMCCTGYGVTTNLDYVSHWISACELGMTLLSAETPGETRACLLDEYADALQARSRRTGDIEDLSRSIQLSTEAVAATFEINNKFVFTNNLANRLEDRYDRRSRLDDLLDAIEVARAAVAVPVDDITMSCGGLHNLGVKLMKLSQRTSEDKYLQEGFDLITRAITSMPSLDSVPATWLNSVSDGFRRRNQQRQDQSDDQTEDLEKAIHYQQLAIERVPPEHPELPDYLHNLAWLLRTKSEASRNIDDIQEALKFAQDAVDMIPEGHVHQAGLLYTLARLYELACMFDFGGYFEMEVDGVRWTPPWENKAKEVYLTCLECLSGDPLIRMTAAAQAMAMYEKRGQFSDAVEIGIKAIDILRKTSTRSLSLEDQEHITAYFSDIAVETCSLSLRAGYDPAQALQTLELGRGLILGLLIDDRSDISQLTTTYPVQAARLIGLQDAMRAPIKLGMDVTTRQELVMVRNRAIAQFDELLEEIRNLPGHSHFLQGPSREELQSYASQGPIVVVNVADASSDAISITTAGIQSVHLPELEKGTILDWLEQEPTRWKSRPERGKKNNLYREFSQTLWDTCVKPILMSIGFLNAGFPAVTPRIWWIGAGVASALPFHAAGDHSPGSTLNTYSHVVSSYIPTIKSLMYAKDRAIASPKLAVQQRPELMVVLMPNTPAVDGQIVSDLNVADEDTAISESLTDSHSIHRLVQPSTDAVLERLKDCDMVHFACHGVSESKSPSQSYLILQRPGEEPDSQPAADKLTVQRVSQAVFHRARICYLSACSTAENRSANLADEVLHLASGFQVAGFPHVIGTLWPSDDVAAVQVARAFYQQLSSSAQALGSDRAVAAALQYAVLGVRARFPRQPLLWAQYVHIGA